MKNGERGEAVVRVAILIISGIIGYFWSILAMVLAVLNWLHVLVFNGRNRVMGEFVEYFNTFSYTFCRYISGVSNERPFPFNAVKPISKYKE